MDPFRAAEPGPCSKDGSRGPTAGVQGGGTGWDPGAARCHPTVTEGQVFWGREAGMSLGSRDDADSLGQLKLFPAFPQRHFGI